MNPRVKIGAFIGALVVIAGMAFGIAKTLSDGDEPVRSAGSAPGAGESEDLGQSKAGVHDSDGRFRVVMNEIDFQSGVPQDVEFQIRRGTDIVRGYQIESDRKMHLIVVRHDLSGFQHVHPELGEDGTWRSQVKFASSGPYRAYADFQVDGKRQTIPFDLTVAGDYDPRTLPDPQRSAEVDGYSVRLRASGENDRKRFEYRVTRNGRPVNDLQDYLGSKGHLVAINVRTLTYSHVHPVGAQGNRVSFIAELGVSEGSFRLFFQFLHDGKVHTVPLTIRGEAESGGAEDAQPRPRESDDQQGGTEYPDEHSSGH